MIKLFIDTSYDVFVGLLDSNGSWVNKTVLKGMKASQIIQKEIYGLLKDKNVSVKKIDGVITSAGPGFYTGMRVSEGVADVFKLYGHPHHAYYNFYLPKWYGHQNGIWMTKAYRGEYFFFLWQRETEEKYLLKESELADHIEKWKALAIPFFIHQESAIDEKLKNLIPSYQETFSFIQDRPQIFYAHIMNLQSQEPSYYFRPPEDEFRPSL